jgi:hypothetical protein
MNQRASAKRGKRVMWEYGNRHWGYKFLSWNRDQFHNHIDERLEQNGEIS